MPDQNSPDLNKSSSLNTPPAIHTMQQDLAQAPLPSRFELRHQRPLAKSERMEDLRHHPQEEPLNLPIPPKKPFSAPTKQSNPLASPYLLWTAGLILFIILLIIIFAIIATL